jgi:4-hydroxy-2-oxoheptanedioate aldolase
MSRKNLRGLWAEGRTAVNGWMLSPSPFGAELMATAGYDCITIDLQHGLMDYADMLAILRALSASDVVPVVRLGEFNSGEVGRALDAGVQALICPLVNTQAQAEALVRAAKYPPTGARSFGPARAALRTGPGNYFANADAEVVVLAMIETAEAMNNLDQILSVPGLDGAYIGPADLGIGLGLGLPTPDPNPALLTAIAQVRQACARHGRVAAVHQVPGISPRALSEQGFRFVTSGIDMEFMLAGAARAVQAARPE